MSSRWARNVPATFFMGSIRERITWRHHWSEKLGRPGGGLVIPELLEVLLEQISANALEVVTHQIFQFHFLVGGEVRRPLEKGTTATWPGPVRTRPPSCAWLQR